MLCSKCRAFPLEVCRDDEQEGSCEGRVERRENAQLLVVTLFMERHVGVCEEVMLLLYNIYIYLASIPRNLLLRRINRI